MLPTILLAAANTAPWFVIGGVVLAVLAMLMVIVVFVYGNLWFQAYMSRASVGIWDLIGMSFRQVPARMIVQAKIMAIFSGPNLPPEFTTWHSQALLWFVTNGTVQGRGFVYLNAGGFNLSGTVTTPNVQLTGGALVGNNVVHGGFTWVNGDWNGASSVTPG